MLYPWTAHYHPSVTSYIYSLRGKALEITNIIVALQREPVPKVAKFVTGKDNIYQISTESNYVIQYELITERKIIRILWVAQVKDHNVQN